MGHLRHKFSHLSLWLVLLTITSGQGPASLRRAAYVTIEGVALYILGGTYQDQENGQMVALDLTVPTWRSVKPPWISFPSLPSNMVRTPHLAALSQSQTELFLTSGGHVGASFDLKDKVLSTPIILPREFTVMNSVSTVTDPSTGKIIVPTGSCTLGSASCGTLIYDTVLKTATRVPNVDVAAPGIPRELGYYALAWSTERKTAMLYGGTGDANGNGGSSYNTQVLEYSPSSEKWTVVNTSGTSPGPIKGACWVPAFNGTFMVLFGGEGVGEVSGGIFFLNIKTLAWTRGDDIEISLRRVNHVCTTAGDSFVAWGGGTRMFSDEDFNREPVIYDMKRGKWTRDFSLVSMMEPAPTSRPAPLGDSPSTGAIAGGIAGGLVVILAAGFIIYRRRKSVAHSIKIEIEQNPQNPDQNQSQKPSIKEEVSPASTPLAGGDSVVKVETGVPVWSPPTPSITNGLEPFVSALTPHQPRNPHQPQTPQPPEEYLVWHNPQEYPVAQTPQERYPMPPSPQHQQLPYYPPPSTSPMLVHDPQAPSASTSPELPLHRPQQIQGHIEPEAERRRWIQQQELEQLELEHRIRQKRLEIERLREEQ